MKEILHLAGKRGPNNVAEYLVRTAGRYQSSREIGGASRDSSRGKRRLADC